MKKKHKCLEIHRTTIAWLNDPTVAGVRGGHEPFYYSKLNACCKGIRDTATVPADTLADTCAGNPDTLLHREER